MAGETINTIDINEDIMKKHNQDVKDLQKEILGEKTQDELFQLKKDSLIKTLKWFLDKPRKNEDKKWDIANDNKWALAIQIALKSITKSDWKPYLETNADNINTKIDGIYWNKWSETSKAVLQFQKDWNIENKEKIGKNWVKSLSEDWLAGKNTIAKILEKLGTTPTPAVITEDLKTEFSTNNDFEQVSLTNIKIDDNKNIDINNSVIPSRVDESIVWKYLAGQNIVDKDIKAKNKDVATTLAETTAANIDIPVETPLDILKKQYIIDWLENDWLEFNSQDGDKINFWWKINEEELIILQFENKNWKYEDPKIGIWDLYYNLKIDKTTNPKKLSILSDNSDMVEKIREQKIILNKLSNLGLPNGWKWGNNDNEVKELTGTWKNNRNWREIVIERQEPNLFHINMITDKNENIRFDFDVYGNFIENKTIMIDLKAFKISVSDWKIILTKINNTEANNNQKYTNLVDIIKDDDQKTDFSNILDSIDNPENKKTLLSMINELPVNQINIKHDFARAENFILNISFEENIDFNSIKNKYPDLFNNFDFTINQDINNKRMEIVFV